jgi:Uncharacterized protein conserved in bacteria (DUF2252)
MSQSPRLGDLTPDLRLTTPIMNIHKSTLAFEAWLRSQLPLVVEADLECKHAQMATAVFPFLRATFYRWAQAWPQRCPHLADGPSVLGVGDLHVENYGTWRDAEGRLVWGVNDLDEACELPYAADLVRLATSVAVATEEQHLRIRGGEAADAILDGYREALVTGGRPVVLAEHHRHLRRLASTDLRDPVRFWAKLGDLPAVPASACPGDAVQLLAEALPERGLAFEPRARRAGLGSLGGPRLVAVTDWRGGRVAREAKALRPSAWTWAAAPAGSGARPGSGAGSAPIHYRELPAKAVRCGDPCMLVAGGWLVRRLAPDCARIELSQLPAERDEAQLLRSMGWELGNLHLGSPSAISAVVADLADRPSGWLTEAARTMADDTRADWEAWRK